MGLNPWIVYVVGEFASECNKEPFGNVRKLGDLVTAFEVYDNSKMDNTRRHHSFNHT